MFSRPFNPYRLYANNQTQEIKLFGFLKRMAIVYLFKWYRPKAGVMGGLFNLFRIENRVFQAGSELNGLA